MQKIQAKSVWIFFIEGLLQNPQNGEVKALSVSVP
jgi:hypothetical protein